MIFAVVHAENGDVIRTYNSRAEAERDLAAYVTAHPELQDEMGLRPYENGCPAGDFESIGDVA